MRGLTRSFGTWTRTFLSGSGAIIVVLVVAGALSPAQDAHSQTPHSVTKTCGYAGGPACPSTAVNVGELGVHSRLGIRTRD